MTDHSNKLIETVAVSLLTALTVTSDTGWGSTIGKVMFAVLFTLMYAAQRTRGLCLLAYAYSQRLPLPLPLPLPTSYVLQARDDRTLFALAAHVVRNLAWSVAAMSLAAHWWPPARTPVARAGIVAAVAALLFGVRRVAWPFGLDQGADAADSGPGTQVRHGPLKSAASTSATSESKE